jgi:tetratricopeptide (TPR) repeat protein
VLVNRGIQHLDAGDRVAAIIIFNQAASIDPSYYLPWFNLGLAHKELRNWREAAASFAEAYARLPVDLSDEKAASVIWNMGITATKLRLWQRAATAWRLLGNSVRQREDGSPSVPMGFGWVRRGQFEPALGERIDPVRMQVLDTNPAMTDLRPGEIVVHDGSRIGTKQYRGLNLPVFAILD